VLAGLRFRKPAVPVIANVTGRPLTTTDEVKTELIEQLCNGVQWQRSVEYMINQGVSRFYEIGPGKVLNGLIRRIKRDSDIQNIGDAQAIESLSNLSP
jgi:[acyl-carrier-protein] S-malonyltransferase